GRWRGGCCSGPWFYSVIFPPRVGRESMTALMPHRQRSEQRGGSSRRGRRREPTALRRSAEQRWMTPPEDLTEACRHSPGYPQRVGLAFTPQGYKGGMRTQLVRSFSGGGDRAELPGRGITDSFTFR